MSCDAHRAAGPHVRCAGPRRSRLVASARLECGDLRDDGRVLLPQGSEAGPGALVQAALDRVAVAAQDLQPCPDELARMTALALCRCGERRLGLERKVTRAMVDREQAPLAMSRHAQIDRAPRI